MFKMIQVLSNGSVNASNFDTYGEMGAIFAKIDDNFLNSSYVFMCIRHDRQWMLLKLNNTLALKGGSAECNPFHHLTESHNEVFFPHTEWDYEGDYSESPNKTFKVPVYEGTVDEECNITHTKVSERSGIVFPAIFSDLSADIILKLMTSPSLYRRVRCSDLSTLRINYAGEEGEFANNLNAVKTITIEDPVDGTGKSKLIHSSVVDQFKGIYANEMVGRNTVFTR